MNRLSNKIEVPDALCRKEELTIQLGFQFEESVELFSEETLHSMMMIHIVGGVFEMANNCDGDNCGNCGWCRWCINIGKCGDDCPIPSLVC